MGDVRSLVVQALVAKVGEVIFQSDGFLWIYVVCVLGRWARSEVGSGLQLWCTEM